MSIALVALALSPGPSFARTAGGAIQGTLFDPNGNPVVANNVNFKVQVLDKTGACVLYEESHPGIDLSQTNGDFSFDLGYGTSSSNYVSNTTILDENVFRNDVNLAASASCPSGVTMTDGDPRLVHVQFDLGSGFNALSPDMQVQGGAYAAVAQTIQGRTPANFIQVVNDGTTALTQANQQTIFSVVNFQKLLDLLSGNVDNQKLTNVSPPTSSTDAATKGYADSTVAGQAVDVSAVGTSSGSGDTLIWSTSQNKWVAGSLAFSGTAGGDLTGNYPSPTIRTGAVTLDKLNATGGGINRLLITDGSTGTTVGYATCSTNQMMSYNTTTGWTCTSISSLAPVTSVAGKTGAVTLNAADINGLGSAALLNYGTSAGEVVALNGTAQLPAVDGSLLTNVNSTKLGGRNVWSAAPTNGQVLSWNSVSTQWQPQGVNSLLTFPLVASPTGSANAPAYSFSGSTQSGLFSPSADTLGFTTAGTSAMTILANGNVGIGTTSASGLFDVSNNGISRLLVGSGPFDGVIVGQRLANDGYASFGIGSVNNKLESSFSDNDLRLYTSGAEHVRFTSLGSVGIGTTSPLAILDIYGTGAQSAMLVPRDSTANRPGTPVNGMLRYNASTNAFEFFQNNAWVSYGTGASSGTVTNVSAGVGLSGGTITTTGTLSVNVGIAAGQIPQLNAQAQIALASGNAASPVYTFANSTNTGLFSAGAGTTSFASNGTASVTITPLGLVGIGTTLPFAGLDVATTGSASAILVPRDTSANRPNVPVNGMLRYNASLSAFEFYQNNAWVSYNTGASSGTITSIVASTGLLGGTITANGTLSVNVGKSANQIPQLSSTAQLLLGDGSASQPTYSFANSTGVGWFSPGAGTAALATQGVTRLIVDSNGNLGVGTTAPLYSFDLNGNLRFSNDITSTTAFSHGALAGNGFKIGLQGGAYTFNYLANLALGSNLAPLSTTDISGNLAIGTFANTVAAPTNGMIVSGSVGIGTSSPLAILDVYGTGAQSAMLVPRDSTANRPVGVNGMLRYNASTNAFEFFQNNAWVSYGTGSSSGTLTSIAAGTGLLGGTITASGTLSVNVGTGAGQIAQYNGASQLALPNGAVTNPALSFANSTNTGVYSPGAGTTAFTNNGASSLTITAAGLVGVGLTNPAALLDVFGTGANSAIIVPRDTTANRPGTPVNGMIRYNASNSAFEFFQNNAWVSYNTGAASGTLTAIYAGTGLSGGPINSVGTLNVNVGTAAAQIIQLNASAQSALANGSAGAPAYAFANGTATGLFSPGVNQVALATNGTAALTITANGSVGVGSTSPQANLDVTGVINASNSVNTPLLTTATGMALTITSGSAASSTSTGNAINVTAGTGGSTYGAGGALTLSGGTGINAWTGGAVVVQAGPAMMGNVNGASATIRGGTGSGTSTGGGVNLIGGSPSGAGAGGTINITGGSGYNDGAGGAVLISGGTAAGPYSYNGGNLILAGGQASGTGAQGTIQIAGLVGLGTLAPAALLDVYGTGAQSAMLVPRDSTANRPAGVNGMLRYNASTNAFEFFQNNAWVSYGTGSSSGTLTSIAAGTGLLGGTITASGTLSVNVGTAAAQIVQLNASAQIAVSGGSPSAPTYGFANSANTGMFSTGAGTTAFASSGVTAMTIDGNAHLGVGTAFPAANLDVANVANADQGTSNAFNLSNYVTSNKNFTLVNGANVTVTNQQSNSLNTLNGMNVSVNDGSTGTYVNGGKFQVVQTVPAATSTNGVLANVSYQTNSNANAFSGGTFSSSIDGSNGTIAKMTGINATVANNSSGATITSAYGVYTGVTNAGTVTNAYGLYVSPVAGTNKFGIYEASGGVNYFGGGVGIGTSIPAALLDVYGTGAQSAMLVPRDSTANRPAGVNGMLRYNASTSAFEFFQNNAWVSYGTSGAVGSVAFPLLASPATTSASAPSYSFSGNTNTGLFSPATNNLAFTTSGTTAMTVNANGFVGIGTSSASTQLTVSGDATVSGKLLVEGGSATGTRGIALGVGASAAGPDSIALQSGAAVGVTSFAAGANTRANGTQSFAVGDTTTASGQDAVTMGYKTTANGNYAAALNNTTQAPAYSETAIGLYNTVSGSENGFNWVATDPLFVVGNGSVAQASNALTLWKNGQLGLGTSSPAAMLDVYGIGTATSAMLVPRDSTANRPSGVNGMLRYNASTNAFEFFQNNAWVSYNTGTAGAVSFPLLASPATTSAGAPSYSFSGNTNTGLYSPGANQLALSTNGTTALAITSAGAVGIGTGIPGAALDVLGTVRATGNSNVTSGAGVELNYAGGAGSVLAFDHPAASYKPMTVYGNPLMLFGANGSGALVDNRGFMGILTYSPQAALDVAGSGTGGSAMIVPRDTTANRPTGVNGMLRYNASTNVFEFFQNNAWVNYGTSGAVGSVAFPLLASPGTTSASSPSYSFSGNTNTGLFSPATNQVAVTVAGSTALSVSSNGYVGIGSTSPGTPLDVVGSARLNVGQSDALTLNAAGFLPLQMQNVFGSALFSNNINWNGSWSFNFPYNAGSQLVLSGGNILLQVAPAAPSPTITTAMIVTQSSLVGIGTVSPMAQLDVYATGTAASAILVPRDSTANRPSGINGMLRYNASTNAFEFFQNNAWVSYGTTGAVGSVAFPLLASPATASASAPTYSFVGNANTGMFSPMTNQVALATAGTTAVTIAANGFVGIGTTSPATALDVNGGIRPGSSTAVTATCNATTEGIQRYNYSTHFVEYCNGTNWTQITAQAAGSTTPVNASGPPVGASTYSFSAVTANYTPGFGSIANTYNGNWPAVGSNASSNTVCAELDTQTAASEQIVYDLGSNQSIGHLYVSAEGQPYGWMSPYVSFSQDNVTYNSSTYVYLANSGSIQYSALTLSTAVTARYIKVTNGGSASSTNSNSTFCQIAVGP